MTDAAALLMSPDRRRLLALCAMAGAAFGTGRLVGDAFATTTESALNTGQKALVALVADTIIPDTDTPGAAKAGVPAFIDLMVSHWLSNAERTAFLQGADQFERDTIAAGGRGFAKLSPAERLARLKAVQAITDTGRGQGKVVPFFLWAKRLTVFGYYTSETGAAEELTLNLVPGEYQACAHVGADHAFSISRGSPILPVNNDPVS